MNTLLPHFLTSLRFALGNAGNGRSVVCLTTFSKGARDARNFIFCAAVGVALGTRFKILALGPAIVLALVTTISFGVAARWGFREVATMLVISLVALQLGYFAGGQSAVSDGSFTAARSLDPSTITFSPTGW